MKKFSFQELTEQEQANVVEWRLAVNFRPRISSNKEGLKTTYSVLTFFCEFRLTLPIRETSNDYLIVPRSIKFCKICNYQQTIQTEWYHLTRKKKYELKVSSGTIRFGNLHGSSIILMQLKFCACCIRPLSLLMTSEH